MTSPPGSFPPDRHLMRDLAMTSQGVGPGRRAGVAPLRDGDRDRSGRAAIGFLAVVADAAGTLAVLPAAQPDWTATADLSLHATGVEPTGPLVVDARVIRAGSRLLTVSLAVHDGQQGTADDLLDELVASAPAPSRRPVIAGGTLSFVRMPSSASAAAAAGLADWEGRSTTASSTTDARPLVQRCGIRVVGERPATVALARSDYVVNSMGGFTGPVHAIAAQAAAEARRPDRTATDVHLRFLAPARGASLRATSIPVREHHGFALDEVEVVDGDTGAVVSIGTVGLAGASSESRSA